MRLVVFAAVAVVATGLTVGAEDLLLGSEEDVIELFGFLTPAARVIQGGLEVALAIIGVAL